MVLKVFPVSPLCAPRSLLLFVFFTKVWAADVECNRTEVKECYSGLMNNLVKEFTREPFNVSRLDTLCSEYEAKSRCAVDISPCLDDDFTIGNLEKLYSAGREDACGDRNRNLLKTLIPSATCPALQLLLSCVEEKLRNFNNASTAAESTCSYLETGLRSCLITVGPACPPNRHRYQYTQQTLRALLETQGCPFGGGKPVTATVQPDASQGRCSYRQLKRCLDKQVKLFPALMERLRRTKKPLNMPARPVCRRTRAMCHQHNVLHSCNAAAQDTIRRMEEAMDVAQAILCENNGTLIRNLYSSSKSWDGQHFKQCFIDDNRIGSITAYLFATPRLERACRQLRQKIYHCLNESYTPVMREGGPQPDVSGALRVLAAFLDRIPCVRNRFREHDDGGDDPNQNGGDVDYHEAPTSNPGDKTTNFSNLVLLGESTSVAASLRYIAVVLVGQIALLVQLVT